MEFATSYPYVQTTYNIMTDDYAIIGTREPQSRTSVRRRIHSLNQDEQQDLPNIRVHANELLLERDEAQSTIDYALVKIANARRLRDIATENRIRKSVIEPVSSLLSKIEDDLLHCIEDKVDIAALSK